MYYSSKFLSAFENLMILEGGKTKDTGGWTNFGITLRSLMDTNDPDFDKDHDGDIDKKDLWSFNKDDARLYVYRYWWNRYGFEHLNDHRVAIKYLDICYNVGMPMGTKLLQRAIVSESQGPLRDDGVFGPKTVAAANATCPERLRDALRKMQREFYLGLIAKNPAKYLEYKNGWLRRAAT